MTPSEIRRDYWLAPLPDVRLRRRLVRTAEVLSQAPNRSFPEAFPDASQLEAVYRLLNNGRVNLDALLAPHFEATTSRCQQAKLVIVAHDTTYFSFPGTNPIAGLGMVDSRGRGFSGHFALAIDGSGAPTPLGVMGVKTIMRNEPKHSERDKKRYLAADNEMLRWPELIDVVEERLGSTRAIHVADREGDWYDLMAALVAKGRRFVIRMAHDRRVDEAAPQALGISDFLWSTCAVVERMAQLSSVQDRGRSLSTKLKHPSRKARVARLEIATQALDLRRPVQTSKTLPASLRINVVHVREPEPPEGVEAVEWFLATTEPIDTAEQALAVVDIYRARWLIEEFFKALKTGCAYEKRQLESADALLNALGLFVPMAWSLLRLRSAARSEDSRTDAEVLTASQIRVLRAVSKGSLPKSPTLQQCALAVARLGGYLNTSRPPGWIILARGLEKLLTLEAGWRLAQEEM